jgi:hypothetical protein
MKDPDEALVSFEQMPADRRVTGADDECRAGLVDTVLLISWILGYAVLLRVFGLITYMETRQITRRVRAQNSHRSEV